MTLPFDRRSAALALAVVAVWGTNFVVIKLALDELPPLLFAALRYAAVVVPAVLLVRRPAVRLGELAAYGLLIGVVQFGLLFIAIDGRIAPGLASLLIQTQVVFTLGFMMRRDGTRLLPLQYPALLLAGGGVAVIALNTGGATTPAGIVLVLAAALGWAGGNVVQRGMGRVDMLGVVVWSSLFAAPALIALALVVEGPARLVEALAAASPLAWAAVAWQAIGNTMFGYGVWGWLLARHDARLVAPLPLLVPVFGMGSAAWLLGEPLPPWKLGAGALILGGLALNLAAPRLARRAV